MLVLLYACAGTPEAAPPPAPPAPETPAVPPSPPKATAPCERLQSALWPAVADPAPVLVVVDRAGPVSLPATFVVEADTERAVQGRVPGTDLCALAGLANVELVRAPFTPSPKVP
ncbi:MAG: hypothetical protein ACOZNI_36820 [Myxococcota bacterium]